MKTYMVEVTELRTAAVEVEADNEEQAREEASALYFEEKLEFNDIEMSIGDVEICDV